MPKATPDHYVAMLDRAKEGEFAYPAINVTISQTLNAALQGFAAADSDGIIMLESSVEANTLLEIEVGVIGGEEDGVSHEINEQPYSNVDDARATIEALGTGERGRYLTALTFGNVQGVYHPDSVQCAAVDHRTRGAHKPVDPRRDRSRAELALCTHAAGVLRVMYREQLVGSVPVKGVAQRGEWSERDRDDVAWGEEGTGGQPDAPG
jgi:Fructose-bisphosphate aldolase class-II